MTQPKFRERKVTQAAATLLQLRGGTMSYLKLMKLLYLADCESLLTWGRPMWYDNYVSMEHGMVLSRTLDLITEGGQPKGYWSKFISPPCGDYEVKLEKMPETDDLSEHEESILVKIFAEWGAKRRWDLRDFTHTLPEWVDPHGSAIPLRYSDVLRGAGKSEHDISQIENEIESIGVADLLLSSGDAVPV